jgi:hypothetical protein
MRQSSSSAVATAGLNATVSFLKTPLEVFDAEASTRINPQRGRTHFHIRIGGQVVYEKNARSLLETEILEGAGLLFRKQGVYKFGGVRLVIFGELYLAFRAGARLTAEPIGAGANAFIAAAAVGVAGIYVAGLPLDISAGIEGRLEFFNSGVRARMLASFASLEGIAEFEMQPINLYVHLYIKILGITTYRKTLVQAQTGGLYKVFFSTPNPPF